MKVKLLTVLMSHLSDLSIKQYISGSEARGQISESCEFLKFLLLKFPNTNTEIDPEEQFAIFNKPKEYITPRKCETCNGTGALAGTSDDCPDCMGSGLFIPDEFIL